MSTVTELGHTASLGNTDSTGSRQTEWYDTDAYLGDVFTYVVGTAELLLGIQAILMNALVISFYLTSYKKVVPFMYLLMAACDSVTGISAVLTAVVFLTLKVDTNSALHIVPVAYTIFSITFKVSVFLNLAIAVVRTINILLPFYRMRIWGIAVAAVIYTLSWLSFTIWQLQKFHHAHTLLNTYLYSPGQHQAVYTPNDTSDVQCRNMFLFLGLPFVLPSCIVVVCMAIQIRTILKQRPDRTSNTQTQRQITITIFALTVLFFFCNTIYLAYPIHFCLDADTDSSIRLNEDRRRRIFMMAHITGVVCPFINAALNPVILVVRGQALSGFLKRKLQRFSTTTHNNLTNMSLVSIKNPNFKRTDTSAGPLGFKSLTEVPLSSPTYNGPTTKLKTPGNIYNGPTTKL